LCLNSLTSVMDGPRGVDKNSNSFMRERVEHNMHLKELVAISSPDQVNILLKMLLLVERHPKVANR